MNAMILAAGRGKRLMPLTKHAPKPLVRINGKPILAYHLERLHTAGIVDVIINVSYLGHLIVEEFGYRYKGLRIFYSFEPSPPLETAGGIAFAKPWVLSNQPFLVINSDILCDWPLSRAFKIYSSNISLIGSITRNANLTTTINRTEKSRHLLSPIQKQESSTYY